MRNKQWLKRYIQSIWTFHAHYTRKAIKTRRFIRFFEIFGYVTVFFFEMYYYIITTSTYVFQQLIARWIEWHIDSCFVFSVRWEHFVVQDVAVVFFLLKISSERVFWSQRKFCNTCAVTPLSKYCKHLNVLKWFITNKINKIPKWNHPLEFTENCLIRQQ